MVIATVLQILKKKKKGNNLPVSSTTEDNAVHVQWSTVEP